MVSEVRTTSNGYFRMGEVCCSSVVRDCQDPEINLIVILRDSKEDWNSDKSSGRIDISPALLGSNGSSSGSLRSLYASAKGEASDRGFYQQGKNLVNMCTRTPSEKDVRECN